jgi:hypothetical protein
MTGTKETPMREPSGVGGIARLIVGFLGLVILAGVAVGFTQAWSEDGNRSFSAAAWGVTALWALLVVLCIWLLVGGIRQSRAAGADMPPRERRSLRIVLVCMAIGVVVGVAMTLGSAGTPTGLLSDGPLSPGIAWLLTAIWVLPLGFTTIWWLRAIDEHERAAYREGAEHAGHALLILAPAWWLLHRGGVVPAPDAVIMITAFAFIWVGVWAWRKYFD